MNEKEQDFGTLDLEDILKEFGSFGEEEAQPEEVTPEAETEELTEIPEPVQETAEPEDQIPEEFPLEDMEIPLELLHEEEIPAEQPAEETIEEEPSEEMTEEERLLEELAEITEEAAEEAAEGEEAGAESAVEEPAEEAAPQEPETMESDYIPPEPILFRPRSRLRELKRKLIAGPEKRYYELSELGVGKMQVAMIVCLIVVALSAAAGAMYAVDALPANRLRLMVFGQILAMLLGALMGYNQLLDGIGDLFHGKFTMNTMLFFTFIACCGDGLFCLREQRVPICAAFTLEVLMALWAAYERRTTEMGQMDTMRKATRLDSVVKVEDFWEGKAAIVRGEGQVEDFMDHYSKTSAPERRQNIYAAISLLVSLGVAVTAGLLHSVSMGFQIFSTTMLVSVPASFFVATTRPMAVLERRLHSLGTVLCGWHGVKKLSGRAVYLLDDQDIFPNGSVKMNGVKFYGDRDPEVTISYAASLMNVNGGGLAPVFRQLLESRSGPKYPVKNFEVYPGGIGGEICGEKVVMGSMQFLQDMGVEIPAGTMVNQAVYVSIGGEFTGLFAITYSRMKYSASGIATICAYKRLTPVIMADDFMLTASFLKEKFGVSIRRMVFPNRDEKAQMRQVKPREEDAVLALTTHEGLAPAAYAVTGARALRTACNLGLAIHMIGGILGMLIMAALAVIGAVELLTPLNVLVYQLVWMIPGLLITEWTRAI